MNRRAFSKCVAGSAAAWAAGCAGRPTVQTSNDWPTLRGLCAGMSPITEEEYAQRRETARKLLRDNGQVALVMESSSTLSYYGAGRWRRSERPLLYVLPVSGKPFWIGPAFEEGKLRELFVGEKDLAVWQEHESPYVRFDAELKKRGTKSGVIAVEPTTRQFVARGLSDTAKDFGFASGQRVVDGCRTIKSKHERALLRRANIATKASLREVSRRVTVGMTEDDVRDLVHAAQRAAGLSDTWALVGSGPHAAFPHGTKERRAIASGDLVLVDTGGSLHGYQSDITRTWPVGRIDPGAARIFSVVLEAQRAAKAAIRPGQTCGAVDAAARSVMHKHGFGQGYEHLTHRLGHGIGIEGHEAPYFVAQSDTVLEPGMTLSNEPGIYLPGRLGVRIEDIIAVTDEGVEVFGQEVTSIAEPFGPEPDAVLVLHAEKPTA